MFVQTTIGNAIITLPYMHRFEVPGSSSIGHIALGILCSEQQLPLRWALFWRHDSQGWQSISEDSLCKLERWMQKELIIAIDYALDICPDAALHLHSYQTVLRFALQSIMARDHAA